MEEDYATIREALLSLICVGDTVYHIFMGLNDHPHVRSCTVTEIIDNESIKVDMGSTGWVSTQYYEAIEVYNGRPYIWNDPRHTDNVERLELIGEIIKSEHTICEYF